MFYQEKAKVVVNIFTTVYLKQNSTDNFDKRFAIYKEIAHGLIAMNSMIHSPHFDKKPTFDDYLKFLDYSDSFSELGLFYSPLDKETLKGYFEMIKENELKAPILWTEGFDKYLLAKKAFNDFNFQIYKDQACILNDIKNIDLKDGSNIKCCDICLQGII